jgi:hypothetical protein
MPGAISDPYVRSVGTYECVVCGARERSSSNPGVCRVCGGTLVNLAVSRE